MTVEAIHGTKTLRLVGFVGLSPNQAGRGFDHYASELCHINNGMDF